MTTVITTFSIDGYELYGKRMIKTWLKYWPENYKLHVYTEGYNLTEKHERLIEVDIDHACPDLQIFKDNSKQIITDLNNKKFVNTREEEL